MLDVHSSGEDLITFSNQLESMEEISDFVSSSNLQPIFLKVFHQDSVALSLNASVVPNGLPVLIHACAKSNANNCGGVVSLRTKRFLP